MSYYSDQIRHPHPDPWNSENVQAVVDAWSLSPEDQNRLKDLQQRLSDVDYRMNDPHTLVKFMFAPAGYEGAEAKFRAMIQWRMDNNVDNLVQNYTPPPLLLENTPNTILDGYDREGDPIFVERGGALDVSTGLKEYGKEALMRHGIWMRELITRGVWLDDYEQRQQRKTVGVTCIYDLKGLSSKHLDPEVLGVLRDIVKTAKEYYPGKIKRVIIIRANPIFRMVWSLVKHFFRQQLRDKMIFAGKNYLQTLDKYMHRSVLPQYIYEDGQGRSARGLPPVVGSTETPPSAFKALHSRASLVDLTETAEEDDASSQETSIGSDAGSVSATGIARGYWVHRGEEKEIQIYTSVTGDC